MMPRVVWRWTVLLALMEGGGSGEDCLDGDADGSRLYQLMTHEDTPVMPPEPGSDRQEKLDIIRQWIGGGLLENSGSKVRRKRGPSLSFAATDVGGKPEVIAMPEKAWRVPVVTPQRAAAASAIATSPWAPLVAIAGQRQVAMYNTDTGILRGIIPYPEGVPQVDSVQPGRCLSAGRWRNSRIQGTASLYDVKTGERVVTGG